jgi:phosphatidylglycerol---prolipoprotein diacylglyceryl transferase
VAFPVYIWIGPLQIHPHFLFEALAYAIAFRLVLRGVRRDAIPLSQRTSIIVGGMVGALVGAKLLVLFQHLDLLWQDWHQLLWLLVQGKTVVGALLGGLIGVELTKKWIGVTQSTGDVFVYPLIVGTAIGRIGCFLTGLSDRTYGIATTLPWGVNFGDGIARHPTQLYEIIFLLGLLLVLKLRENRLRKNGDRFKIFLMAYLGFRFLIDFIKPEFRPLLGLSAIQLASLLGIVYYHHDLRRLMQIKPGHHIL